MRKHKVLLAGATGYLGKFIATELANQYYHTRLLVRDKIKAGFDSNQFEIIQAKATEPTELHDIFRNIDIVISTLGITKQKDGLTYMDVDYQANLNLLNEAKKAGVKKFIYVSAFMADKLRHLKICQAKEKFVDELIASGLDYAIIRPNGFFSDTTEFLKMAKKGKAELFGNGSYKMNPIHGQDLAEVCISAIESNDKNIEVGGPEVFTHKEIVELAFNTLNKKVKISYMPEWLRKTILWITRTFTSSKTYGPMEFFFTVLAIDMVAPKYGKCKLKNHFNEVKTSI